MVPAGAANSCVSSATTALPNFKMARIETPSTTPAVRYVNVSGTFLADVAITIGKWSTVKYSGTSVDVVTVVSVAVVVVVVVEVDEVVVVVVAVIVEVPMMT